MDYLMGFAYFALDALAILLLVAIWQRSRINGFLVLAASYCLGIAARWGLSLFYRLVDSEEAMSWSWTFQFAWLLASAVGLYGLWEIYRHFKRAQSIAPPLA